MNNHSSCSINTLTDQTPAISYTERFLSLKWSLSPKGKDSVENLEAARALATELAQILTHSNSPDLLILAGSLYRYLKEPVLASTCFWWIDQSFATQKALNMNHLSQVLLACWWAEQKNYPSALSLVSDPIHNPDHLTTFKAIEAMRVKIQNFLT